MTTCEKCKVRPAEYGIGDSKGITIRVQVADRPEVTQAFQPSRCCETCLEVELLEQYERLNDRETLRWLYRQELDRRQSANEPSICSDCRRETREFAYLSVDKAQKGVLCQACLSVRLRDQMLKQGPRITDATTRLRAVVAVMDAAKQQARRVFEYVWG